MKLLEWKERRLRRVEKGQSDFRIQRGSEEEEEEENLEVKRKWEINAVEEWPR